MLKKLEVNGFKSFAKKTELTFDAPITAIVGPNGSGKSNVAEALRWVLGEQSMKSLRGKRGEDLIWNGSKTVPRQNRASVTIVFDNKNKIFDIDFDEVAISREVHRDGVNEYSINGTQVRLKDVYELLSRVSVGASGHHIISQGEADRILNASPKDRRLMIEDALGLKIYQYKKGESERRLEKTLENIKEAELIRRELAPHLRFLKKQIEQIQKAEEMRTELGSLYREYFLFEKSFIEDKDKKLRTSRNDLERALEDVDKTLSNAESSIKHADSGVFNGASERLELENRRANILKTKDDISRRLGKIDGLLESFGAPENIFEETSQGKKCKTCGQFLPKIENIELNPPPVVSVLTKKDDLEREHFDLLQKLNGLNEEENDISKKLEIIRQEESSRMVEIREAERSLFDLKTTRNDLVNKLERLRIESETNNLRLEQYKREYGEAAILLGREKIEPVGTLDVFGPAEISIQDDRRRKIERLKIRIEDMGAGGQDTIREFDDVSSRDEHLAKEIADLEKSAETLRALMDELTQTLEQKFHDGLEKINVEFSKFFATLFNGGEAHLAVTKDSRKVSTEDALESLIANTEDEKEPEWGIEIQVNLPRKKIRGLEQLSGGERALTSIALVFAMSQVNPPPFMVLDETDAALDEANSRRYGDIIETLSRRSQLILITHNRETMSRASVLYGVTMNSDSVSRLLSVRFDEAANYAK